MILDQLVTSRILLNISLLLNEDFSMRLFHFSRNLLILEAKLHRVKKYTIIVLLARPLTTKKVLY